MTIEGRTFRAWRSPSSAQYAFYASEFRAAVAGSLSVQSSGTVRSFAERLDPGEWHGIFVSPRLQIRVVDIGANASRNASQCG
jgi:hypothetical protein